MLIGGRIGAELAATVAAAVVAVRGRSMVALHRNSRIAPTNNHLPSWSVSRIERLVEFCSILSSVSFASVPLTSFCISGEPAPSNVGSMALDLHNIPPRIWG